jgi:hypothetical protein
VKKANKIQKMSNQCILEDIFTRNPLQKESIHLDSFLFYMIFQSLWMFLQIPSKSISGKSVQMFKILTAGPTCQRSGTLKKKKGRVGGRTSVGSGKASPSLRVEPAREKGGKDAPCRGASRTPSRWCWGGILVAALLLRWRWLSGRRRTVATGGLELRR